MSGYNPRVYLGYEDNKKQNKKKIPLKEQN